MRKILYLIFSLLLIGYPLFSKDTDNNTTKKTKSDPGPDGNTEPISSTWININNIDFLYPISMPAYVSAGIFYDEIDILFKHPAELANYKGYSIFTAYANQSYNQLGSPANFVYPFTTLNLDQFSAANLTQILAGYILPIFNFRAGLIGGFRGSETENLQIGASSESLTYTNTTSGSIDADFNAVADYIYTNTESYTDFTSGSYCIGGTGIDLGFMGISLFANISSVTRNLGGYYQYGYTKGETTTPNDTITVKNVYYGQGTDGAVTGSYDATPSNWKFKLVGELPLKLAGLSMPVTAGLICSGSSGGTASYAFPMTVNLASINVTGAAAGAASTSSIAYTIGQAMASPWDPNNISGILTAGDTFAENNFRTAINTALGADAALDKAGSNISNISFGLDGNIDPKIPINKLFAIKTKAYLKYTIISGIDEESANRSINYSEANAVSSNNSLFSFTENIHFSNTNITNDLKFELGGILEFHDKNFLTIGTGFFYCPEFYFQTMMHEDMVIQQNYSWQDQTNTDPVATAANTAASDIGPASAQGSGTYTSTTVYSGDDAYNMLQHRFYIPVSLKLDLVKDKFCLIGGYIISHTISNTYSKSASSSTSTVNHVYASYDWTGTAVYTTPDSIGTNTTSMEYKNTSSNGEWTGTMNFMLRFSPAASITLDLYGQTVMNALNFGIFGGGAGFNPNTFIDSLGISISINIE